MVEEDVIVQNKEKRNSAYTDIGLLALLTLATATAILMILSGHIFLNVIYLFCAAFVLMLTYFFGLMTSLITNIVFIAAQAVIMIYEYVNNLSTIPWQLSFWMLMPLLMSLALYFTTRNQVELQKTNSELRNSIIQQGAFDEDTHLRTTVAYVEDVAVFTETNKRFDLPVSTAIIKIRYYDNLKRMMTAEQIEDLLKLTTDTIKASTRVNDITYLLNNEDPTWAILLFSDAAGTGIAANRVKTSFEKRLKESTSLSNIAISMAIGISSWDSEKMDTPYDLMNAGIRETQYDV